MEKTEEGNRIMQRLVGSMDSIQQANGQLQNIGKVIAEITAKTSIINDIVFKTQLLSFNASIEAARAGQHGRGFAVVAAEVGNLAQMSGGAAKEIQVLLDDSRSQVQSILESTQERVSEGQTVSADALATFGEIAKTIDGIAEQIRGINEATLEQEIGVKQTSKAMVQMDEHSQRNNVMSQQVAASASEIEREADRLFRVMQACQVLVFGSKVLRSKDASRDLVDSLIGTDEDDNARSNGRSSSASSTKETTRGQAAKSPRAAKNAGVSTESLVAKLQAKAGPKERADAKDDNRASGGVEPSDANEVTNADDDSFRAA